MKTAKTLAIVLLLLVVAAAVIVPNFLPAKVDRSQQEWKAVRRAIDFCKAQQAFKAQGLSAEFDAAKQGWFATSLGQLDIKDQEVEFPSLDFLKATSPDKAIDGYYFVLGPCGQDDFGIYAAPAKYGRGCRKTFYAKSTIDVWEKDIEAGAPRPGVKPDLDDGWHRSVLVVK